MLYKPLTKELITVCSCLRLQNILYMYNYAFALLLTCMFMTGETINAEKAMQIGLVQEVFATPEELIKKAQDVCDVLTAAAPGAVRASKSLVANVQYKPITADLQAYTAEQLAQVRMSDESTAGMLAVQTGKKPPWNLTSMKFPSA